MFSFFETVVHALMPGDFAARPVYCFAGRPFSAGGRWVSGIYRRSWPRLRVRPARGQRRRPLGRSGRRTRWSHRLHRRRVG